jgi:SNARE protein 1
MNIHHLFSYSYCYLIFLMHRKLQEDLTDEMVELARQLKESSLMMNQYVQEMEKILDSTERAVEHSLASTGRATS